MTTDWEMILRLLKELGLPYGTVVAMVVVMLRLVAKIPDAPRGDKDDGPPAER